MKSTLSWTKALVLLAVVVCVFGGTVFGQPWDGNGVEGDPYLIYDANDMQEIGADVNYLDAHFKLMADINLAAYTGTSFNIIGDYNNPFTGVFDGNGHTISNYTHDSNGLPFVGIFGYVDDANAKFEDLSLVDSNVHAAGNYYAGSVVGFLKYGTIIRCNSSRCSVSASKIVGNLVGLSYGGTITNCSASGTVSTVGNLVGGLVGLSTEGSQILNCWTEGNVSLLAGSPEGAPAGGLVGHSRDSVISNCYSSSDVSSEGLAGGLVGNNWNSSIFRCYARGNVSGTDWFAGGLVGANSFGTISNSYSTGDVSVPEGMATGGLVGVHESGGTLFHCYSTGRVSGDERVGGLVGAALDSFYTKCFWDSDINPDVNGIGNTPDPNVMGETTANMQTESTFTDAGWDFNTPIWKMCDGTDYPKLGWEECPEPPTLLDVVSAMLDPNSLKNSNMKNALINKINAVLQMIDEGQYEGALNKLENDILAKTDGCAEMGQPDKNDWITTCEEQTKVYPLIIETIEYVRTLME